MSRVQCSSRTNKSFKAFYASYNSPRYTPPPAPASAPPHRSIPRQPPHVLAVAEHTSTSPPPPDDSTSGYAMPVQLDEDDIWDYYAHAMVMTADPWSCLAVHQHMDAIGFDDIADIPSSFSAQSVGSFDTSTSLREGDFVQVPRYGDWLIDSGASNYYTSLRHILTDFRPIPDIAIQTGSGIITGKGIGNVTIHSTLGIRKIHDVIWVPQLAGHHNLLSIPQLARKGCKVTMSGPTATIYADYTENVKLLEGSFRNTGYLKVL